MWSFLLGGNTVDLVGLPGSLDGVKRGVEVYAVVPHRQDQKPQEVIDGIHVLSFSPLQSWTSRSLYVQCHADVHHSCEPSLSTYLAMNAMPYEKHVNTMRDTRDHAD